MPPESGIKPIFEKAWMNEAFSWAIVRSHANAMLAPAPAATPLTAAITGFSRALIFKIIGL